MKQFLIRWYLLNKRLFKKAVFILILCTVPMLILALNAVTAHSGGFVNIAIAMEDPDDSAAQTITSKLLDNNGIVQFTLYDTEKEAMDCVRYGEADGAWIISDDIESKIANFVSGKPDEKCVRIVERENTVALSLAREKLAAALSYDTCYALMRQSYAQKVSADFDEVELRGYFDRAVSTGELFEFKHTSGEIVDYSDTSYLMLPIRGVLAVSILLCGFAMALFRIRDEQGMVFCRVSRAARPAFELGYHLTGIFDIAVIVLISLYAAGLATTFLREIVIMAVYCLNCAVFVIFMRFILRSAGSVAAVTPLIIVTVLVVNPILLNLPFVYPLRLLTPVYYYLQATHDASFILYGLLYFAVLAAIDLLILRISERFG